MDNIQVSRTSIHPIHPEETSDIRGQETQNSFAFLTEYSCNMPSNSAFVAAIAGALLMAAMIVVVFNKDHADSGSQPCAVAPPDSLARNKTQLLLVLLRLMQSSLLMFNQSAFLPVFSPSCLPRCTCFLFRSTGVFNLLVQSSCCCDHPSSVQAAAPNWWFMQVHLVLPLHLVLLLSWSLSHWIPMHPWPPQTWLPLSSFASIAGGVAPTTGATSTAATTQATVHEASAEARQ